MVRTMMAWLVVFSAASVALAADSPGAGDPARVVGVKATTAMFLKPDAVAVGALVAKDAEAAYYKPGDDVRAKIVDELRREGDEMAKSVSVREIVFFIDEDLRDLKKRFPGLRMWDENRLPKRLGRNLGCLIVSERLEKRKDEIRYRLDALVIREIEGDYKLVYFDYDKITLPR